MSTRAHTFVNTNCEASWGHFSKKKVWGPWEVSPVPPPLSGPALRKSSCLLWHLTPASSKCAQLWTPSGLLGQSTSLVSLPPQFTLSRRMGPVPWPNCANETAVAPVGQNLQIVEQNCCRVRNGLIVILYWQYQCLALYRWHLQTCSSKSKLSACYVSIRSTPEVITHCAPLIVVVTDLNSTFTGVRSTLKSDAPVCTCSHIWQRIQSPVKAEYTTTL